MKRIIPLFIVFLLLSGCDNINKPEPSNGDPKPGIVTPIIQSNSFINKVSADNKFAFDLFKEVLKTSEEQNEFISPLSVSIAIGMLWNGAQGETKEAIATMLHMNGMEADSINEYYRKMQSILPNVDPNTKLTIANSIWYKTGYTPKTDYLTNNKKYFDAEVRELDFIPSDVKIINNWCAEKTNDLIKKPLNEISEDAFLYLINAIYFKGVWETPFNPDRTRESKFHSESGIQNTVDMMCMNDTFDYTKNDVAKYINLPYGNESFSMTVILPNEGKEIDAVLNQLTVDKWNTIKESMKPTEVYLKLPRFKSEQNYELLDVLTQMGMFSGGSNFTGIIDRVVQISRIIHGTFVEVNEEGTEAAAVTIIGGETTGMYEPYETFYADKPFLYIIHERNTGAILFMGKAGDLKK